MEDTEQISVNGSLSSERASVSSHDFEEPDEKKGDTKSPNRVLIITLKSIVTINMAPPIGIYQLVNYLQKYGIGCDVFDRELEDLQVYIDKVRNGDYDVVGISVSHQNMTEDLEALWKFMEAVRDGGHHTKIVAGGQEATLNWRQWIDVGVEVAFLGFAEKAFLEFCRRVLTAVDNGTPQDIDDYVDGVPGVAYRDRSGEYQAFAAVDARGVHGAVRQEYHGDRHPVSRLLGHIPETDAGPSPRSRGDGRSGQPCLHIREHSTLHHQPLSEAMRFLQRPDGTASIP